MGTPKAEGVGTPTPLEIVISAAEDWVNELLEHIAPHERKSGEDEAADEYEAQADRIAEAIKALRPEDQPAEDPTAEDWTIRVLATALQPGQRFIFDEAFGGENEEVTCQGYSHHMGTVSIDVEEFDHAIDVTVSTWVTVVGRA